jgi:hypothetical protein
VFALPVLGSGDGGAYTTVADVRAFWSALFAGRIVVAPEVARMTAPVSPDTGHHYRYGLGFWLAPAGPVVMLEGCDHGVSFRSWCDPGTGRVATVIANTTDGAWPVARVLGKQIFGL